LSKNTVTDSMNEPLYRTFLSPSNLQQIPASFHFN
jgi:hypothetical protein